jgi:hypothetical protein
MKELLFQGAKTCGKSNMQERCIILPPQVLKNMKNITLVLLVATLLGCASKPVSKPTAIKFNDGTHYVIKTNFKPCQLSRDWAVRTLTIRANEICKSGYVLIDEQTPVLLEPLGAGTEKRELSWEIKCREPS